MSYRRRREKDMVIRGFFNNVGAGRDAIIKMRAQEAAETLYKFIADKQQSVVRCVDRPINIPPSVISDIVENFDIAVTQGQYVGFMIDDVYLEEFKRRMCEYIERALCLLEFGQSITFEIAARPDHTFEYKVLTLCIKL